MIVIEVSVEKVVVESFSNAGVVLLMIMRRCVEIDFVALVAVLAFKL